MSLFAAQYVDFVVSLASLDINIILQWGTGPQPVDIFKNNFLFFLTIKHVFENVAGDNCPVAPPGYRSGEACNNTPRYLTYSADFTHVPFKETSMLKVVYALRGEEYTDYLVTIKITLMLTSAITTSIQEVWRPLMLGPSTTHIKLCHQ